MEFNSKIFSTNLRAERARRGLTQAELAEAAGVSADAVFKYENGVAVPGVDKAFSMAAVLGCTPNDLLGWKA